MVLGDGRLRAAVVADVGAGLRLPATVVVAVPPAGEALRALELTGPGSARRTVPVRSAPAPFACDGFGFGGRFPGRPSAAPPVALAGAPVEVAATATHRLHAAHAADGRLCLALDRAPATETDCGVLPRETRFTPLSVLPEDGTVFTPVPARVATAEVVLSDGTTQRVPTAPPGPYAGTYAASSRFVRFSPPAKVAVAGVRLLAADGRLLGVASTFEHHPLL